MDYYAIIKEYDRIQTLSKECSNTKQKETRKLLQNFYEDLQEKTFQERSQYFSKIFDIWTIASKRTINIETPPFSNKDSNGNHHTATKKSENPQTIEKKMHLAKETKILSLDSVTNPEKLHNSIEIIEYGLQILWLSLFKNNLSLFVPEKEKDTIKNLKTDSFIHKNWPLYELLNQIGKTIAHLMEVGKPYKTKFSNFFEFDQNNILGNTEELCLYILKRCILNPKYNNIKKQKWFPEFTVEKRTLLPYIIATSDSISYMFEYKLKSTKEKNKYIKQTEEIVEDIFNNIMDNNTLYNAIDSYLNEEKNKDRIFIQYKHHYLDPKLIFIFTIVIIQETIKKILTKSRGNIFYILSQKVRDKGLTEKSIILKIKKDKEAYMRIYHYFDNPTSATIKQKEKNLKNWFSKLDKLRYGVLDDYLLKLSETTQIQLEETITTSIKLQKK